MFRRFAAILLLSVTWLCAPAAAEYPLASDVTFGTPADTVQHWTTDPMLETSSSFIGLDQARVKHPNITGSGYSIAVIDTGVKADHPALAGRYLGGYDFVNDDSDPTDDHGHGTHVAGIAVSGDATYPGIAPEAGHVALKVLDAGGSGSFTNIENALQWVVDNRETHNIVAVNMSLGTSTTYNSTVSSQISNELSSLKAAGVFIACAAGNGWYSNQPDEGVAYPAADASAVAVGSVWTDDFGSVTWSSGAKDNSTAPDRVVSHSDRSTTMMDILAPGAIITSAAHDWQSGPDWKDMSGTSMATPAVAGFSILLREAIEENWDPADWPVGGQWQDTIIQIMRDNAVMVYDGDDEDDNVANLNAWLPRIDVVAALDATVPEPTCLALLAMGSVVLMRRRRR